MNLYENFIWILVKVFTQDKIYLYKYLSVFLSGYIFIYTGKRIRVHF